MGFRERRAERFRPAGGKYRPGHGPGNGGSNQPLRDPVPPRNADPVVMPGQAGRRTELTRLLGRSVLAAHTQRICAEYGLIPRSGPVGGSGPSRWYLARDAGVEIAADAHGTVTTVFLHFHGDDGFASYRGEIPGGGGADPRRAPLRASLGRPDESGEGYRDRFLGDFGPWDRWLTPGYALHAQYALDGDLLHRITLTLPERTVPRAA
jgi:hypothetical protein